MIFIWIYALIGVVFVSLLSLLGAFSLAINEQTLKKILIYFVSFSTGALFGDVFIHILPEITKKAPFTLLISFYFLFGILTSFIIEKAICWNHNHHQEDCHEKEKTPHVQSFAYLILFADGFHNFIDGLVIGAGFLAGVPVGIATILAVILHEIPHEIGDFGVLIHGGFTRQKALFYNFLSGLTAIVGTIVSLLLNQYIQGAQIFLLSFAAANFIYIAGSNLIPELHKNTEKRKDVIQILTFIAGVCVMLPLLLLEK